MAGLTNREIAGVFRRIEILMRVLGEDDRRAQTYGRVAWQIERMQESAADLAAAGRLLDVKGIGPRIQTAVAELVDAGTCTRLEELSARVPPGVPEILRVPGLGPKRVHTVLDQLHVESLEELVAAAGDGRLASLKGFGARTVEKVLEGVAFLSRTRGRLRVDAAQARADEIARDLGLKEAAYAGPLRRGETLVDTIVIVAVGQPNDVAVEGGTREKDTWVVARGAQPALRVRLVPEPELPRALFEETGPASHVAAVLARPGTDGTEAEIYTSRGLHPVPPERRHACDGSAPVPGLIEEGDLQGLVHAHTVWSDGRLTVDELAEAAQARGYRYLAVTDHSYLAQYAHGLSVERLEEQAVEIRAFNRGSETFRVLHGTEVDILSDGSLDYPDAILAALDFVIASVHSAFSQDEKTMTARLVKAIRNPHVDILGHPTGRLLLRRDAYAVDMEQVLAAAAESRTAVELNASPWRLDLDPALHARAQELGVRVPICPDAHSAIDLDVVAWGVRAARHGGLRREDVPNAADAAGFLEAIGR
ncbi:MAG: helix-hairpin-helix domain-containing protein [Planctomycetota bacterium]|jgi:DNA polymerase (family 10)